MGVASFSDIVQPQFQLNTYQTLDPMLRHIDRMPHLDQSTNTQEAIKYARTVMLTSQNGDRATAPNSVIVITDGVPQIPHDPREAQRLAVREADLLRQEGITVIAIGVGPQITQTVLSSLANQPPSRYTFQVNDFQQLQGILGQVASAACPSSLRLSKC